MRRNYSTARKAVLGAIYTLSLLVWAALVSDTAGLAQRAATPPVFPTSVPMLLPTVRPPPPRVIAPAPAPVLQNIAPEADQRVGAFHPKTGRYISAWLTSSFSSANRSSFEANADILDEVSPFWYSTNARGNLLRDRDARDETLIELAHSKNVLVLPTIHNVVHGGDPVPALLLNADRRSQHVRNIVEEVLNNNYDGIDIDYEALDSSLREEYSALIIELSKALHAQGKLLTIAVHAKDCDYCGLGGYQDWLVLGQAVDRLRIMTYDYSWRGGGAGPVAPLYWVNAVAEYAKSVVDPAKVVIGVQFYGYDWPANGGDAKAYTWENFKSIIDTYKPEVNLVETDSSGRQVQENKISYNTRDGRRTAYFATSRGLQAKLELVQRVDLAGIAIWQLGGEDPQNWDVIRGKLVEDPFESQRMLNQVLPEH
ncbi:MAG: glycosyl hydrolase family 18 protein [Chloroflexota bacterium]|nr:glycosyl hydrolase family 18 protein [Chloroflexota bacterium]